MDSDVPGLGDNVDGPRLQHVRRRPERRTRSSPENLAYGERTLTDTLLSIRGLNARYQTFEGTVRAVEGVNLDIDRGEVVALVGESGCGKSTLGLSILRLIMGGRITAGEIIFEGEDLLKKSGGEMREIRGKKISMIFQDPTSSLNPVFTVGYQLAEAIACHEKNMEDPEIKERVIGLLGIVGIPDSKRRFSQFPHEYSGGMRQRAMIAMALSCNPSLLIADEPTTNLDVTIEAQILDVLRQRKDLRMSILLITHNMGIVAQLADKVAVMYAGDLVEFSDCITIFTDAKHPYTSLLLRTIPRVDTRLEKLEVIPGRVPSLISPPSGCKFHPRCSEVMDICRRERPTLIERNCGHKVACHLY